MEKSLLFIAILLGVFYFVGIKFKINPSTRIETYKNEKDSERFAERVENFALGI